MPGKKIQTIGDLAELAGVSKSTVSRALSDNPLISQETRTRIQTLAKEHGFHRDSRAQSLSRGNSRIIGCTVCNSKYSEDRLPNLFQMELIQRLSSLLREFHYDLMILNTDGLQPGWPERYYFARKVDGFILLSLKDGDLLIDDMLKIGAPFVSFGERDIERKYPSVQSDNQDGMYRIVKHLIQQGYTKIGHLKGPNHYRESEAREAGYRKALSEAGLTIPFTPIAGHFSFKAGKENTEKILSGNYDFDALAVSSDAAALGAMSAIKQYGKSIPRDIAVTGFDNIFTGEMHSPTLTTVAQDMEAAAEKLLENLREYMDHGRVKNTVLPVEIKIRQSG